MRSAQRLIAVELFVRDDKLFYHICWNLPNHLRHSVKAMDSSKDATTTAAAAAFRDAL